MKTTLLVAAALFFSTAIFAQKMTYDAGRTTFGVRAGVNFFSITGKDASGTKLNNDIKTGFDAGVNAEIPVGTGSYVQPGILYTQKGAKYQNNGKLSLGYIEVPVNFLYKPVLGTGRMLLGVGPYVGYGIGGKFKGNSGSETDVKFTNDYLVNVAAPQFKRLDYGGNLVVGYEFVNNFSVQLNAQLGLADLTPHGVANGSKLKQNNTGFGISAGYRF